MSKERAFFLRLWLTVLASWVERGVGGLRGAIAERFRLFGFELLDRERQHWMRETALDARGLAGCVQSVRVRLRRGLGYPFVVF